jgi:hypothetical protein
MPLVMALVAEGAEAIDRWAFGMAVLEWVVMVYLEPARPSTLLAASVCPCKHGAA